MKLAKSERRCEHCAHFRLEGPVWMELGQCLNPAAHFQGFYRNRPSWQPHDDGSCESSFGAECSHAVLKYMGTFHRGVDPRYVARLQTVTGTVFADPDGEGWMIEIERYPGEEDTDMHGPYPTLSGAVIATDKEVRAEAG